MTRVNQRVPSQRTVDLYVSEKCQEIASNRAVQFCVTREKRHRPADLRRLVERDIAHPRHYVTRHRAVQLHDLDKSPHIAIHLPVHAQFLAERNHVALDMAVYRHAA